MAVKFSFQISKALKESITIPVGRNISIRGRNGKAVILIHGLTGTPNEMRFLASRLNRGGFSISCPRLANHDRPLNVLKNTPWQDFYATVRQAYFKAREHSDTIFVGGLSMGALLALLLADEFPQAISGVSCLSPTLFYDGWNCPWYRCFLPALYWSQLHRVVFFQESPPYGIKNAAVRQKAHEYFTKINADDTSDIDRFGYPYFPVSLLRQMELLVKHLRTRLPRITTPVQVIQAKDDDMTSVKNGQFIYDHVASRQKELVILENSYHIITADQERGTVLEKMQQFFEHIVPHLEPAHA